MNDFITALAPAFAIGFALERVLKGLDIFTEFDTEKNVKIIFLVALVVGGLCAQFLEIRVLAHLKAYNGPVFVDKIVTAFIISAGTEGFNTILKFMKNAEEKKEAGAVLLRNANDSFGTSNKTTNGKGEDKARPTSIKDRDISVTIKL